MIALENRINIFGTTPLSRSCGIYSITHSKSGKAYIGRSKNIRQRWHSHICAATKSGKKCGMPLLAAMKTHGIDGFVFRKLIECRAEDLEFYELTIINGLGTWSPGGYNVGGTSGGYPTKEEMALMPPKERERREEMYRRSGELGREKLAILRQDSDFEREFRRKKSEASRLREHTIREKRESDPVYDEKILKIRRQSKKVAMDRINADPARRAKHDETHKKSSASFQNRMKDDQDFAARVRENRRRAALLSHESRRRNKCQSS